MTDLIAVPGETLRASFVKQFIKPILDKEWEASDKKSIKKKDLEKKLMEKYSQEYQNFLAANGKVCKEKDPARCNTILFESDDKKIRIYKKGNSDEIRCVVDGKKYNCRRHFTKQDEEKPVRKQAKFSPMNFTKTVTFKDEMRKIQTEHPKMVHSERTKIVWNNLKSNGSYQKWKDEVTSSKSEDNLPPPEEKKKKKTKVVEVSDEESED